VSILLIIKGDREWIDNGKVICNHKIWSDSTRFIARRTENQRLLFFKQRLIAVRLVMEGHSATSASQILKEYVDSRFPLTYIYFQFRWN
jgi:hypothetical protein